MKIIKISKHILPNKTYKCGYCNGLLDVVDVTYNPKHFFNPGQEYSCPCEKSKVWTNSVRKMDDLERYCDGKPQDYDVEHYGFCNDKFCPKCWTYISVIKNSQLQLDGKNISWEEIDDLKDSGIDIQYIVNKGKLRYVDIHGCESCDNNNLIHQGIEGGEYDGQKSTAEWYKSHQHMWRNLVR